MKKNIDTGEVTSGLIFDYRTSTRLDLPTNNSGPTSGAVGALPQSPNDPNIINVVARQGRAPIPAKQPWDPNGHSATYILSPGEGDAIENTYDAMMKQLNIRPGTNAKIGMHPYTNNSLPKLPTIPGGQWYSATVPWGDGVGRLLINTGMTKLFFYSPDHYSWFMPGVGH